MINLKTRQNLSSELSEAQELLCTEKRKLQALSSDNQRFLSQNMFCFCILSMYAEYIKQNLNYLFVNIDRYVRQLSNKKFKSQTFSCEILIWRNNILRDKKNISALQQQLQVENTMQKETITSQERMNKSLSNLVSSLREKTAEDAETIHTKQQEIYSLQMEVERLNSQVLDFSSRYSHEKNKIESELKEQRQINNAHIAKINELTHEMSKMNTMLSKQYSIQTQLEKANETMVEENKVLQKKLNEMEYHFQQKILENATLLAELAKNQSQTNAFETEARDSKKSIETLQNKYNGLLSKLNDQTQTLSERLEMIHFNKKAFVSHHQITQKLTLKGNIIICVGMNLYFPQYLHMITNIVTHNPVKNHFRRQRMKLYLITQNNKLSLLQFAVTLKESRMGLHCSVNNASASKGTLILERSKGATQTKRKHITYFSFFIAIEPQQSDMVDKSSKDAHPVDNISLSNIDIDLLLSSGNTQKIAQILSESQMSPKSQLYLVSKILPTVEVKNQKSLNL
ncbi:intracellular protein transport protein USO1 [Reticulomyxa filosa]|uniref:Intracellular protein transport protein USO1 n=1 Tax=Reticulomyxa filosa TaxID=46433 RepID=X6ML78_RETFI|nr:intracellular protein transport protein USO1 [Reticulomyxa filosa]|eukprot:ETO14361.1 intracellular protein transport protein USO1 [Reticulomyxa filosa]